MRAHDKHTPAIPGRMPNVSCHGRVLRDRDGEALTPNDFDSTAHGRHRIRAFFAARNRRARPFQWT